MNRYLLLCCSIVLFSIPFINFDYFYLSWIFLIPILYLIEVKKSSPLKVGAIFGTLSTLCITYWATNTLSNLSGSSIIASALIHLIYCIYESIFFIAILIVFKLSLDKPKKKLLTYSLLISFYVVLEQNFPRIFPYKLGNSQILITEISQLISIFGLNILSILTLIANITLYEVLINKNIKLLLLTLALGATSFLSGKYILNQETIINENGKIKLAILQPNNKIENLISLNNEIHQAPKSTYPYLSIWPESSLDKVYTSKKEDYAEFKDSFSKLFGNRNNFILLGSIVKHDEKYYNAGILINQNSQIVDTYYKNKLMIFGEYYPFQSIISKIIPVYSSFVALEKGSLKTIRINKEYSMGVIICYEDLFEKSSLELSRLNASILINLTNDIWYGGSRASYQHLMLSIPRAIENKKFLIRSANTGISAIISPNGKIKEKLGINKSGYLIGDVLLSNKKSFYLSNYKIINLFYYIIFFSLLALFYKKARNN